MSKKINGLDITTEFLEYGVEYDLNGETFVQVCDDEEDARFFRAVLQGTVVSRRVYETAWADASDD